MNNDYVSLVLNDLLSRTRYSKLKLNKKEISYIIIDKIIDKFLFFS